MNKMSHFAETIMQGRYSHDVPVYGTLETNTTRKETWNEIGTRTVNHVLSALPGKVNHDLHRRLRVAVINRKFMPGGRYLYASGRDYHQTQNCLLLRAQDSREGWGCLMDKVTLALMTGAGLGINYSLLREEGSKLVRSGGTSSGPLALAEMVNACARGARQGGARRGAIWAGLSWKHPDIMSFITSKNWSDDLKAMKAKDFNSWAPLDCTNISVCLDDEFFQAYTMKWHPLHDHAVKVYWLTVRGMLETGEPGFSVDTGKNAGEDLRNACTEVTSADDSDICNLGSINIARCETVEEFKELVELGTLFLLAGTVYSDVPYRQVAEVREKNRRLGLGIMGVHEWLLKRGKQYGPNAELATWLAEYAKADQYARHWADTYKLSVPVKTRAIAPNGTIGIVAETTTSGEPLFCAQYKRRFRDGETWKYQYVIDPVAQRLVDQGVSPDSIEDAQTLAGDYERRMSMQTFLQSYVDHAISSTINLPAWGSDLNNESTVSAFGNTLMRHLPHMRGVTVYPDGARGGQPLTRVTWEEVMSSQGQTFIEAADICDITKGGSCG
jgi:ribonucleoside-diphosphate reductase alpha chain